MKTCSTIILSFLFVVARCLAADDQATLSKSFTVEAGGTLTVDADQGDIDIVTGEQNTVQIVVERKVNGNASALAAALKTHTVKFDQDGKNIHVESHTAKSVHGIFSRSQPNLEVHFQVTIPKRFNAVLNTDGGNISVTDLNGTVDARSSGGNLTFKKIQGVVDAHTSGGNVSAASCTDKLTVQTSGGNITIKDYSGSSAQADTSGGNVDVTGCTGKLQVKTSGGNIAIREFSGASAFGDTSGGAITVAVDKQPTGDCWFHTSGGNITVKLPETIALNLNAETLGGSASSAIPVIAQGKAKEGKLEGKINGGGPLLSLRTSGGDIRLVK